MNYRIGFSLFGLIALSSVVGCAGNDAMRAQMAKQDQTIQDLQGKLAVVNTEKATGNLVEAGKEGMSAAAAAWNWASAEVKSSLATTEAYAHKCYDSSVKLDNAADYKALALRCWNATVSTDDSIK